MKVVFFEDVEGTARVGDIKDVKNGFARNFLLPRNIAGPTNKDNLTRANSLAQKDARRQERLDAEARETTSQIGDVRVEIQARVGESGRLFGSVTNRDIAEKLGELTGMTIDSHIVLLPEPIRELGERTVSIKFTRNVIVEVAVEVVPDEESKPVVARLLAEREALAAHEAKKKAEAEYAAAEAAGTLPVASTSDDEAPAEEAEADTDAE